MIILFLIATFKSERLAHVIHFFDCLLAAFDAFLTALGPI